MCTPISSIIHNSELKTTQVAINAFTEKQNVVYTQNEILLVLKKEENPAICYNMDEPWGHFAKWNKPETNRKLLYDSPYMRYLAKITEIESRRVDARSCREKSNLLFSRNRISASHKESVLEVNDDNS